MTEGKEALKEARARLVEFRLEVAQDLVNAVTESQLELLHQVHRAIGIVDTIIKEADVSLAAFLVTRLDDSLDTSG
jgi:hypothetical protein